MTRLKDAESPLRAEFRIPLERFASYIPLINRLLNEDFVKQHFFVFEMSSVANLLKFCVLMLAKPIEQFLNCLIGNFSIEKNQNLIVENILPTISAFESLLTYTLFSGLTYSFMQKIVWSKGSKVSDDLKPLILKQSMEAFNRLNFTGHYWKQGQKLINASNLLLKDLVQSQKIRNRDVLLESFNLFSKINEAQNIQQVSKIIWNSYFELLWNTYPNDFDFTACPNDKYSLLNVKLSQTVKIVKARKPFHWAVESNFNIPEEKLIKISKQPFMICYRKYIGHDEEKRSELNSALIGYAFTNVKYVYVPTKQNRIFYSGRHSYCELAIEIYKRENIIIAKADGRRKRIRFTDFEKIDLIRGINTFCRYKNMFQIIIDCKYLCFKRNEQNGTIKRSKAQLDNLLKTKKITCSSRAKIY